MGEPAAEVEDRVAEPAPVAAAGDLQGRLFSCLLAPFFAVLGQRWGRSMPQAAMVAMAAPSMLLGRLAAAEAEEVAASSILFIGF